jgi:hypothetical protein
MGFVKGHFTLHEAITNRLNEPNFFTHVNSLEYIVVHFFLNLLAINIHD